MAADTLPTTDDLSKYPATAVEARAIGSVHYFTGKPCKRGHLSLRLTSCNKCRACQVDFHWSTPYQTYIRAYRVSNKTLLSASNKRRDSKSRTERPWYLLLKGVKSRAAKRGIDFSLTKSWAEKR